MKKCIFLLLATALGGLLPACRDSFDATRFASFRVAVEELVRAEVELLEMEKSRILHEASQRGNLPRDEAVVKRANHLHRVAQGVLSRLDRLQKGFIAGTGRDTALATTADYTRQLQPGPKHREELVLLEQELRSLFSGAGRNGAVHSRGLFLPGGPLDRLKERKISLAASLAGLWEIKLETARYSLSGLESLRRELIGPEGGMLPYPAVDAPAALREGDSLRIKVALRGIIPHPGEGEPVMTCDGNPLVVENGIGKIRFIAQGPPGKKHWEAAIRVRMYGRDTVFRATQTYWVLPQ